MEILYDNTPSPEDCTTLILESSGHNVEPKIAAELWPKILQHKWVLSEKLGRDVGFKVACLDFIENVEPLHRDLHNAERIQLPQNIGQ